VDEMQGINMEFVDESVEVLNNVMNDVMELNSETDSESINNIFRAFHSMKGNSRMLGFERLGAFGHKAEDVLSLVRNGIIVVDKPIIDLLLHTIDMMFLILGDIRAGTGDGRDTTKAVSALDNIITSAGQAKKTPPETTAQQTPCSKKKPAKPLADTAVLKESRVAAPVAAATKSNAGGGIMLDLSDAAPVAPQAIPSEPRPEATSTTGRIRHLPGSPLKILIAEDDFTSRTILTQFLSEFGDCHIAKDGLEAIAAFTHAYEPNPPQPYDLICMDMMMPNMDGAVAAKTIREIERSKGVAGPESETAIVFTSAVSDPATIIKACYECGSNYYFVKPLDFKQMKRQMKKLNLII
jgi:two-component system chemotaxis response regulator CheY